MKKIIKPTQLPKQGTIGIIAPAGPVLPEKLDRGIRYLESLGYRVEVGASVYAEFGYLAGNDESRVNDLETMFQRPDIDAIFCARGGYGCTRILSQINYDIIAENPRILVGYSDITALQLAIFKQTGLLTFSGPMAGVEFANDPHPQTESFLWRILSDPEPVGKLSHIKSNCSNNKHGKITGHVLGGCLSLVAGLAGTPFLPDFDGAIFLMEDVGEKPYKIDAMLAQLKNAGVLAGIAGTLAGEFLDCEPEDGKSSLALEEVIAGYFPDVPLITNFPYGHGPLKYTLPTGGRVELDSDEGTVTFLDGCVTAK